jgi:hypothetical protein
MSHVNFTQDCEAVNYGLSRMDYFFYEPKAFPRNLEALRWSFFQSVGGR